MKILKKVAFVFLCVVSLTFYSCSGCDGESPTVKITNSGTGEVSVQVKTTGGNTENLNNVPTGQSSASREHAPGIVTYTIVLENKTELVETFTMSTCEDYLITVNLDNSIALSSTSRD